MGLAVRQSFDRDRMVQFNRTEVDVQMLQWHIWVLRVIADVMRDFHTCKIVVG
jgi:hypothetical protein